MAGGRRRLRSSHALSERRRAGFGGGRSLRGDRSGTKILSASCRRVGYTARTDDCRATERSASHALGVGAGAAVSRRGGDARRDGAALRSAVSPVAVGGGGRRRVGIFGAAGGVPGGTVMGCRALGRQRAAERGTGSPLASRSTRRRRGDRTQ